MSLAPFRIAALGPGHDRSLFESGTPALDGGEALPLDAWLEQTVNAGGGARMTMRQLIRQVCDQDGGAHVDRRAQMGVEDAAERARLIRAAAGAVLEALQKRLL